VFAAMCCWLLAIPAGPARAAAPAAAGPGQAVPAPAFPSFQVRQYQVRGYTLPAVGAFPHALTNLTGTNVSLADLVDAAAVVQAEYTRNGGTNVSVSIAPAGITNGLVTMHVFHGGKPQILVGGKSYKAAYTPGAPISLRASRAAPPARAVPHFTIQTYEVVGDTLLTNERLAALLLKHTGTNLTVTNILAAASELQMEYRNRGYPTVRVNVPEQSIGTNGLVRIRVFEGILTDIDVTHNHYFSSNNVMRALPSLHTNTLLVGPVFQAELDRANANQDRQIWPQLEPGAEEGTSRLTLEVKDRLPLHGRVEINSQNTPGTPEMRVNSSAVYQNLWQLEHSVGVQYGFAPELYKAGNQWEPYDRPLVANYGAFYRMPLGSPEAISDRVAETQGRFGYDEATRKFQLPPSSGRAEFNLYASRSTIDTGWTTLTNYLLTQTAAETVRRRDIQEDLTVNQAVGFRFSQPVVSDAGLHSLFSGGADFKAYDFRSNKTNLFTFTTIIHDQNNNPVQTNVSTVPTGVAPTHNSIEYLPLTLRYDGYWTDALGTTRFGIGLGANLWYSGAGRTELQNITGSTNSSGHWLTFSPSLARDFSVATNWVLTLRADGQFASEPLMSPEQYGLGGLNTVRGYHEGENLGDSGWHISAEQGTPPYLVGRVYGGNALVVRGSVYMDYGESYLLDPQGRPSRTQLWGSGFGAFATLGPRWEARFMFSWPLLSAGTTTAMSPRFDFSLSAQF